METRMIECFKCDETTPHTVTPDRYKICQKCGRILKPKREQQYKMRKKRYQKKEEIHASHS